MSSTGGQLGRAVKRCRVEWDSEVADPRDRRGRRHKHHGLLNLLVLGFASGLSTLRPIEELSADLRKAARGVLGLRRAVSDTTLFMLLSSQTVVGLRNTLVAQVKALWRSKRISNDLFPFEVLSLDGKSVWSSAWKSIEGAKEMVTEKRARVLVARDAERGAGVLVGAPRRSSALKLREDATHRALVQPIDAGEERRLRHHEPLEKQRSLERFVGTGGIRQQCRVGAVDRMVAVEHELLRLSSAS